MPVRPNFLERTAFYSLNAAPAPILDVAGAISYYTLSTAMRLNIFSQLQKKPATTADLAQTLDLEERGLEKLLQALAAINYLTEKDGVYHNSKMTRKWFLDTDIIDLQSLTLAFDTFFKELWPHAPSILKTGERPFKFYDFVNSDPELASAFQKTMIGNANIMGPDVVAIVDLPQEGGNILDIGGGHGKFTIQFCESNPNIKGKIVDSAPALETARDFVSQNGLNGQIELVPGDIWEMDWGNNNDVILLFNFIHHYDIPTNKELLSKAFTALNPGGKVAILDQLEGAVSGSATNAIVQLVGLMFYIYADGRTFTKNEVTNMLSITGFEQIEFSSKATWAGTSLVTGTKGA